MASVVDGWMIAVCVSFVLYAGVSATLGLWVSIIQTSSVLNQAGMIITAHGDARQTRQLARASKGSA